jgi:hypothetical protein
MMVRIITMMILICAGDTRRLEGGAAAPLLLKDKAEIQRATQKYDDRDDEAGFGAADSDLDSR